MIDAHYLVDHVSDAAFAIGGGLNITAWNRGAQQLLGYAPGEVIGRHCSEVIQAVLPGGESLCVPSCDGIQCFRRERSFAASVCHARHKDGGWVAMSIASVVMPKQSRRSHGDAEIAVIFLRQEAGEEKQAGPPSERALEISVLGRFGVAVRGRRLAVETWERKQALTLLKYLVAHLDHPVHREALIEYLWPDVDEGQGRERLKVTVYFLRRQLRAAGLPDDVLQTIGKTYVLNGETVWVDAETFQRLVAEGLTLQRRQRWGEALDLYEEAQHLYRGDYMEEDIYIDWCAAERERLREIYLEALAGMVDCHAERGHYAEAVQVCRTALVRDPCRESFHRALMEHLVQLGRADWALAHYQSCRRILARELGVEPMPETRRLHRRILEGDGRAWDEKRGARQGE
jgi:PAS domain S-box-containing protein